MKQKKLKIAFVFTLLVSILVFTSCSPNLHIKLSDSGDVSYTFNATISPMMEEMARSFSGSESDVPLFNRIQIQDSLESAGFEDVTVKVPDNSSVSILGFILEKESLEKKDDSDLLPLIPSSLVLNGGGKTPGELKVSLSSEVLTKIVELIPPETAEYIDLLSAPVFTGDEMSAVEYAELIAAIYGETAVKELEKGIVQVTVEVPYKINSSFVSIDTASVSYKDKIAVFNIPLIDILAPSEKIFFCIQF